MRKSATGLLLIFATGFPAALAGEVSFTTKPTATKVGEKTKIAFAVSAPTDVAVYVEDAKGDVVRHLVAGVLGGANPPPAPLKPGLAQEVEWDGKADYGKPAEGGPFKVRVGLGLTPQYGGIVHSALPDMRQAAALATGPDGTLYVSVGGLRGLAGSRWRAFSRDGKYLGALSTPPGKRAAEYFGWSSETGEPDPTHYESEKHMNSGWIFTGGAPGSDAVVVGPEGKYLYQLGGGTPPCVNRYPLTAEIPKAGKLSVKLEGIGAQDIMGSSLCAQGAIALSSDGKSLYLGGLASDKNRNPDARKPFPAVVRIDCPERTNAKVFFGDPAATGTDQTHLGGAASGLAVDGHGLLFVADPGNARVVAISEKDGKYQGEIPVKEPSRLGFCARTRALYVLCANRKSQKLVRLTVPAGASAATLKALAPTATLPLREQPNAFLAVDSSAGPTVIWVGGSWQPTVRVEDSGSGAKFDKVEPVAAPPNSTKWDQDNIPFSDLQVDRLRKEIYCRVGGNGRSRLRYNETQDKLEVVEVPTLFMQGGGTGLHLVPSPGGDLYGKQWGSYFYRWDRDGKYKAFSAPRRVTEEDLKVAARPEPLPKAYISNQFVSNVPVAMSVLPHTLAARWSDGHVFSIEPYRWQGKSVGGRTLKALHEYLPGGERVTKPDSPIIWKLSDATLGPRFDAAGNIYVAEAVRPDGWIMPPDLAEVYKSKGIEVKLNGPRGGHYTGYEGTPGIAASIYGSIVKFTPKGGMVHWDKDPKKGPNACGMEPFIGEPKLHPDLKKVTVEYGGRYVRYVDITGAEWVHPGIGHVGFFGCNCENVTFDVDEFGRVFFPDPAMFRVGVIDTNGNAITKFGGYGGASHMGPDSPVVDPKTNRLRPRRPDDPKDMDSPFAQPELGLSWLVGVGVTDRYAYLGDSLNQRLLRAKLTYAAEESCDVR